MKKITLMLFAICAFTWQSNAQLTEDFESGTFPPAGWAVFDNGAGATMWVSSATANTGAAAAFASWQNSGAENIDWLVSGAVDLSASNSAELRFFARQAFGTNYGSTYEVRVSTASQTTDTDFTVVASWDEDTLNAAATTYEEKVVDLSAYDGMTGVYIAFVLTNDDGDSFYVDDVTIADAPSCGDPTSPAVDASPTTADLSWDDVVTATSGFDWVVMATGGDPDVDTPVDSGTTGVGVTMTTATGLVQETSYDFYVRSNCGVAGTSGWAGPISFTTPIPPPVNDLIGGAIPITPSPAGTGCVAATFTLTFSSDGTTDSGLDGTCNTTFTGLDQFFTWTATTDALLYNDQAPGNPGIIVRDTGGTEISCAQTFAADDSVLSGWTIGQDLIIQIYDYGASISDVAFCLEEYTLPAAPNCASNPMPVDMATGIPNGSVTLSWDAPATGPAPTSYDLYAGAMSDGSDLALVGNYTTATADVTVNGFDTTIYWQIVPKNGPTGATGCPLWSLTTGSAPQGATCGDPIVIGAFPSTTSGDTNGFGDDYGTADEICSSSGYLTGDDIVYAYTPASDQEVNFTLSGTGTWTGIFIYEGCAPFTTCVASDTNSAGNPSADNVSLVGGTTYYVVISTYPAPQSTVFTLDIYNAPPVNDDCAAATPLTLGAATAVDNTNATDSGVTASCDSGTISDIWYSFVATATTEAYIITDAPQVSVWDACGGAELACNPGDNVAITGLTDGTTYYVRINDDGTARAPGAFSITVGDATLGIQDEAFNGFKYFPNPVEGTLSLRAQDNIQAVSVYNMLGQEVMRSAPNTLSSEVDMSKLQTGAYFVKVKINDAVENFRIIKE